MKMPRVITSAAVAALATAGLVTVAAGPAAAGTTACTNKGAYSFDSFSFSITGLHHVEIDVFKGSGCQGNFILAGTVETQGNGKYNVVAEDNNCDNVGMTVVMHGYSIATTGCSTSHNSNPEPAISSIGSPKNFWLDVDGTTNSPAYNLPTEA